MQLLEVAMQASKSSARLGSKEAICPWSPRGCFHLHFSYKQKELRPVSRIHFLDVAEGYGDTDLYQFPETKTWRPRSPPSSNGDLPTSLSPRSPN